MDLGVFGKAIMAFICPGVTLGDDKDCVAGDCLPGTWGDTPVAGIDPCIVLDVSVGLRVRSVLPAS